MLECWLYQTLRVTLVGDNASAPPAISAAPVRLTQPKPAGSRLWSIPHCMTDLSSEIILLRQHQASLMQMMASLPAGRSRVLLARTVLLLQQQQRRLERLAAPLPAQVEWAVVRSVPDGDGLRLADGRRVRYLGIDAPEVGGQDHPSQPWAEEAKALNWALVAGRRVRLVRDVNDVDAHGRLLRYVFCQGLFVNAQLLLAGLATVLTIPPDIRYADLLELCQSAAQQARVGMWR